MSDQNDVTTRREERRQRTLERLLAASRDLFSERGFDRTTIDDIAAAARVSRGTFFNYFDTKDTVLAELHRRHMDKLPGLVDDLLARDLTTAERLHVLFFDIVDAARTLERYLRTITREIDRDLATPEMNQARTEHFVVAFTRVLEPGVVRAEVRTDHPLRFLAQMVLAVYMTTIRLWRQDPTFELEPAIERASSFIADAIAPRDGEARPVRGGGTDRTGSL